MQRVLDRVVLEVEIPHGSCGPTSAEVIAEAIRRTVSGPTKAVAALASGATVAGSDIYWYHEVRTLICSDTAKPLAGKFIHVTQHAPESAADRSAKRLPPKVASELGGNAHRYISDTLRRNLGPGVAIGLGDYMLIAELKSAIIQDTATGRSRVPLMSSRMQTLVKGALRSLIEMHNARDPITTLKRQILAELLTDPAGAGGSAATGGHGSARSWAASAGGGGSGRSKAPEKKRPAAGASSARPSDETTTSKSAAEPAPAPVHAPAPSAPAAGATSFAPAAAARAPSPYVPREATYCAPEVIDRIVASLTEKPSDEYQNLHIPDIALCWYRNDNARKNFSRFKTWNYR